MIENKGSTYSESSQVNRIHKIRLVFMKMKKKSKKMKRDPSYSVFFEEVAIGLSFFDSLQNTRKPHR